MIDCLGCAGWTWAAKRKLPGAPVGAFSGDRLRLVATVHKGQLCVFIVGGRLEQGDARPADRKQGQEKYDFAAKNYEHVVYRAMHGQSSSTPSDQQGDRYPVVRRTDLYF